MPSVIILSVILYSVMHRVRASHVRTGNNLTSSISALNRTMTKLADVGKTLEDYNYENENIANIILNEIADVQFMGMSVRTLRVRLG